MDNKIFKANPKLDCYYETSDGIPFYTDYAAKTHAQSLENKIINTVHRKDAAKTVEPITPVKPTTVVEENTEVIEPIVPVEENTEVIEPVEAITPVEENTEVIESVEPIAPVEEKKESDKKNKK